MTVKPVDQFNIQITYLNKKYKKDKYIPIICILIHCQDKTLIQDRGEDE